jgi:hypothetical protein
LIPARLIPQEFRLPAVDDFAREKIHNGSGIGNNRLPENNLIANLIFEFAEVHFAFFLSSFKPEARSREARDIARRIHADLDSPHKETIKSNSRSVSGDVINEIISFFVFSDFFTLSPYSQ